MDATALYHLLRLEVLHPKLLSLSSSGPLPVLWSNLTTRPRPLRPSEPLALTNRTALIVGATSGCGLELAKLLATHCSRLIITARDTQRGLQAAEAIRGKLPPTPGGEQASHPQIEVWPLDVASFGSIREFSARVRGLASLDVAVLNAGAWHVRFARTGDGFETQLQVNYLGACAVSLAVMGPLGKGAGPGRLLNVTSEGYAFDDLPAGVAAEGVFGMFGDPDALTCYQRYRLSKLLGMVWTHELAAAKVGGGGVEVASFTPGASRTQICRDLGGGVVVRAMMRVFCQSAEQGAWTYVRALVAKEFHGRYFFRERVCKLTDFIVAEKHRSFRQDLVQQTLGVLRRQELIPSDIQDWLTTGSGKGFPR